MNRDLRDPCSFVINYILVADGSAYGYLRRLSRI